MPTGFRTMAIVALGACVVSVAGLHTGDPAAFSRIAQGVVTGIGFLGAGVILQRDDLRDVKGLTTATLADGGNRADVRARELKLAAIATGLAIVVLLLDYIGNKIWPKQPKKAPDETEDVLRTRDND